MSNHPPNSTYKNINEYGLIGDCHAAALVGLDGSIDWCCLPRFDSPSVFAAILDAEKGGRFAVTPSESYSSSQRYLGHSNVLETRFSTADGVATVTDGMPLYRSGDGSVTAPHQMVRLLRCEAGELSLDILYEPRPDYARTGPELQKQGQRIVCSSPGQTLVLESPVDLCIQGGAAQGSITLRAGEEAALVISYQNTKTPQGSVAFSPRQLLERAASYWEAEAAELKYQGPWREEVVRSYLVLHLLTYSPTGAIVAAPTTSLPEELGGTRNWDYRYAWLRDSAFTIEVLLSLGHTDEAVSFFTWLYLVCSRYGDDIHIMYRIDTDSELAEEELSHLEGYRGSRPVRIGNGAAGQVQNDIYGEVLASAHLLASGDGSMGDDQW